MPPTPRRNPYNEPPKPPGIKYRLRNLAPDLVERLTARAARNGTTIEEEAKAALSRGLSMQAIDQATASSKPKS